MLFDITSFFYRVNFAIAYAICSSCVCIYIYITNSYKNKQKQTKKKHAHACSMYEKCPKSVSLLRIHVNMVVQHT